MSKSVAELQAELDKARAVERGRKEDALRACIHAEQATCRAVAARVGVSLPFHEREDADKWGWRTRDLHELLWDSNSSLAIDVDFYTEDRRVSGSGDPSVRLYAPDGRLLARYSTEEWVGGTWDDPSSRSVAAFLTEAIERLGECMKAPPLGRAPQYGWPPL